MEIKSITIECPNAEKTKQVSAVYLNQIIPKRVHNISTEKTRIHAVVLYEMKKKDNKII